MISSVSVLDDIVLFSMCDMFLFIVVILLVVCVVGVLFISIWIWLRMIRMLMFVSILCIIVGEIEWNYDFMCRNLVVIWMILVSISIGFSMVMLYFCMKLKMMMVSFVVGFVICKGDLVRKFMMMLLMMFEISFIVIGMFEVMVMFRYSGMVIRKIISEVVKLCENEEVYFCMIVILL